MTMQMQQTTHHEESDTFRQSIVVGGNAQTWEASINPNPWKVHTGPFVVLFKHYLSGREIVAFFEKGKPYVHTSYGWRVTLDAIDTPRAIVEAYAPFDIKRAAFEILAIHLNPNTHETA
jgi:hypothetical protein